MKAIASYIEYITQDPICTEDDIIMFILLPYLTITRGQRYRKADGIEIPRYIKTFKSITGILTSQ